MGPKGYELQAMQVSLSHFESAPYEEIREWAINSHSHTIGSRENSGGCFYIFVNISYLTLSNRSFAAISADLHNHVALAWAGFSFKQPHGKMSIVYDSESPQPHN